MRPLFLIAAALTLGASAACAQNSPQAVVAPLDRSTGPTVPDTRVQDQNRTISPSTNDGKANSNGVGSGDWRASSGLNSDPGNPDGVPSSSTSTIMNSNRMTR